MVRVETELALELRERHSLADWCARELRLPSETGPTGGRFDLERYPFARGILEAADDPEVEELVITGATQWGKTTIGQAILASLAVLRPAPAMLCAPDADATKKLRNKFYGLCDVTPALQHRVPPEHKRNMSEIDFGNSVCHLAWTGNPQRVAAESCRVVYVTEVDRAYRAMREGALHKLIGERVKGWFDFLKIFEGTPTDEQSTIIDLYEKSDKRRFLVPCPHCGHYQALRFFPHKEGQFAGRGGVGGLKDENDRWLTPDEARDKAFYVCEKGCRIDQREKDAMVRQGVWCPEGCKIGGDGAVTGTPKRSRRRAGFGDLCSLCADTITIGRMAAEYLECRDKLDEYRNFINNWCGMRWLTPTKTPKWSTLGRRLRAGHRPGTVPAAALFLTAGADVQEDCVYWTVRAWGEGCTSWLVDWGKINKRIDEGGHSAPDSHLLPLDGLVINREWPVVTENPLGQKTLRVLKLAIDCGYKTRLVHDFARKYHRDLVLTVAGDARPTKGIKYQCTIIDRNQRTGKAYPGGLRRWAINTEHYKADITDRFSAPLDEPGAWFLTAASLDDAAPYLRQITNEGQVAVQTRTGHTKMEWRVIQPGIGNHYLDDEVYSRAAADMVVGGNWEDLVNRFRPVRRRPSDSEGEQEGGFIRKPRGGRFIRRTGSH